VNNSIDLGSHHTYLAPQPFILKIHALSGPYLQYEQWNKHVRELELLNAMKEDNDKRHFTGRRHLESRKGGKGDVAIFSIKRKLELSGFFLKQIKSTEFVNGKKN
jgi:hypothetical protein